MPPRRASPRVAIDGPARARSPSGPNASGSGRDRAAAARDCWRAPTRPGGRLPGTHPRARRRWSHATRSVGIGALPPSAAVDRRPAAAHGESRAACHPGTGAAIDDRSSMIDDNASNASIDSASRSTQRVCGFAGLLAPGVGRRASRERGLSRSCNATSRGIVFPAHRVRRCQRRPRIESARPPRISEGPARIPIAPAANSCAWRRPRRGRSASGAGGQLASRLLRSRPRRASFWYSELRGMPRRTAARWTFCCSAS